MPARGSAENSNKGKRKMASRIYVVRRRESGGLVRYVHANTLNGAVRAIANDLFDTKVASTEDIFQASKDGSFDVLDAIEPAAEIAELPKSRMTTA